MPEEPAPTRGNAQDATFPKRRRVLKRKDFVRIQSEGTAAGSRNFVMLVSPSTLPWTRLGIVASRQTGNAVQRNRGKRRVREWFRDVLRSHQGFDIVIILRRGAPDLPMDSLRRELDNSLRRAIKKARRGTKPTRPTQPTS